MPLTRSNREAGFWLVAIGSMALAGCDSAHVQDCEKQLLERLKAPSTYKRIGINQLTLDAGEPPHYHLVEIEYDAQNSYGALLRDKEVCSYRLDDKGRPTMEQFDPYENLTDANAVDSAVDNALAAAADAVENAAAAIESSEASAEEGEYASDHQADYDATDAYPEEANAASNTDPANAAE